MLALNKLLAEKARSGKGQQDSFPSICLHFRLNAVPTDRAVLWKERTQTRVRLHQVEQRLLVSSLMRAVKGYHRQKIFSCVISRTGLELWATRIDDVG